ncbi:MAG TPA: hypothetical protein PLN93_13795 [Vicinamibacterales bacterium]|nr:hypothetical protein [Vicinamibacterales bacterium]
MAAGHGAADVSSTRAASAPGLKATPAGSCLGLCRPAPAVLRAAVVIALLARSAPAFAADPPGIGWFAQLGLISSAVDDRAALREGIGFRGFGDNADGGLTALALAAGVGIQFDSVADLQPYTVWTESGREDSRCMIGGWSAFVGLRTPAIPVGGGSSVRAGVNRGRLAVVAERGVTWLGETACEDCPSERLGFRGGGYFEYYLAFQRESGARCLIAYRTYAAESDLRNSVIVGVG